MSRATVLIVLQGDEVYVCNFQRDGSRPTVFDMQVLITNHFVLLKGKLIGSERQMEAF